MLGVNELTISGHLTADPEMDVINTENGGKSVVKFDITFDHPHDSMKHYNTRRKCFITVRCYGKTAEAAKRNLAKADEILVVGGKLTMDDWVNTVTQKKRRKHIIEPPPMGLKYVRCKKLGIGFMKEKNPVDSGDSV